MGGRRLAGNIGAPGALGRWRHWCAGLCLKNVRELDRVGHAMLDTGDRGRWQPTRKHCRNSAKLASDTCNAYVIGAKRAASSERGAKKALDASEDKTPSTGPTHLESDSWRSDWIRRRCPEKVERLAVRLWESPMSASTDENHGKRGSGAQGRPMPQRERVAARPRAFREAVLPPVLGPVMTTARVGAATTKSAGTGSGGGLAVSEASSSAGSWDASPCSLRRSRRVRFGDASPGWLSLQRLCLAARRGCRRRWMERCGGGPPCDARGERDGI